MSGSKNKAIDSFTKQSDRGIRIATMKIHMSSGLTFSGGIAKK